MKPKTALLVHPLFLAGLFILLLNDISLKYEFHNGLTGKLSDITGLFVFSFFLLVFFPKRPIHVLLFCGIFFTWWKSPFSQSFIDTANSIIPFSIVRVIDYTDLFALAVLPLSYYIFKKNKDAPAKQPAWIIRVVSAICAFAFCNTSLGYRETMYYREGNWQTFSEEFITRKTEDEILKKFDEQGITYRLDSIRNYRMNNSAEYYQRVRNRADSSTYNRPLANTNDSALYFDRKESPFYVIDSLVIGDDTLRNVEIRFYKQSNKKTGIQVISFSKPTASYRLDEDTRKWYKKNLKKFFK